jgi:AcrR family transcriptional regulator
MAEVATRAGVNPTSIYRRWGGAAGLVVDAEVERLERSLPITR